MYSKLFFLFAPVNTISNPLLYLVTLKIPGFRADNTGLRSFLSDLHFAANPFHFSFKIMFFLGSS